EQFATMAVTRNGAPICELEPAKRLYDAPKVSTTEAAIHASWRGDLYVVLGDELADGGGYVVRIYFHPLVRLIWGGALVMGLGGLRIGAPRRARRMVPTAAE